MGTEENKSGDFSFESILAEIKGSAFINGEKKTPSHLLEAEAERILREASGVAAPEETVFTPLELQTDFPSMNNPTPHISTPSEQQFDFPDMNEPSLRVTEQPKQQSDFPVMDVTPEQHGTATEEPRYEMKFSPEAVADRLIADAYKHDDNLELMTLSVEPEFADISEKPMIVAPMEDKRAVMDGTAFSEAMSEASSRQIDADISPTIDIPIEDVSDNIYFDSSPTIIRDITPERRAKDLERVSMFEQATVSDDEEMGFESDAEEIFEEPRLKDAAIKFARACNSMSLRLIPAAIITLIMVLITFVFEAGMIVPFGVGRSHDYAAGTLILLLLVVMMLCVEVVIRGVEFLIRGQTNAETLILFSCIYTITSAVFTILSGTALMLPFCAVSALSLVFAAFGERNNLRAMADTLKMVISTAEPYGVQAEFNDEINKSVLKKSYSRTDGFYSNLVQADISEILYSSTSQILIIAILALTVLSVAVNGGVENSLHILSALLAAAAPFSALLAYSIPFGTVSKAVRNSGVALAGWGGADDICYTDGVCVTDDDLFPLGTLGLSGVKVYDGAAPGNAMCYTASLIIASGSGLTTLFAEVIKQQGITALRVSNFECHESGVSAIIQGHQVATGSAAYMNLIGVRVPDDANLKNVVFTAVNNKLVAMFAIEYKPLPSVQNALIAMLKWRIDLFFAMRDFNITPSMVGQKFKVPFDSFVFIPVKDSYSISDPYSGKQGRMASVLIREGLGPYADAITSGRLLRSTSFFAAILSVVSAWLGVFLMFAMLWSGSFISATPGNLIIFMLCMLATVLIVCGYVRLRK